MVSWAISKKIYVKLVKGKQRVHQIHARCVENLHVKKCIISFIIEVASIISPILHPLAME
jgi:hypothetical protein